ncbi:hypothetical protein NC653_029787 [Populus alba x Populus x berolinensis]|uniref:Uncharacterized protein n=1 Tax=Populus alba x Populus x berolinensis TaxID=444605 RepID=A0AAD6M3D3_9ROSI|nr:hypothetical protein NC653_029787 [Populus alba x Populus x berolinensis]
MTFVCTWAANGPSHLYFIACFLLHKSQGAQPHHSRRGALVVWHCCIDHHWYNLLSASSAGLLVSIADFMGPKSRGSIKLQTESYVAVPFGAGGMSVSAECSLGCFMSGSESMELAQQGKSLISYLLAAIAMGTRKHGLANSFILSHL